MEVYRFVERMMDKDWDGLPVFRTRKGVIDADHAIFLYNN